MRKVSTCSQPCTRAARCLSRCQTRNYSPIRFSFELADAPTISTIPPANLSVQQLLRIPRRPRDTALPYMSSHRRRSTLRVQSNGASDLATPACLWKLEKRCFHSSRFSFGKSSLDESRKFEENAEKPTGTDKTSATEENKRIGAKVSLEGANQELHRQDDSPRPLPSEHFKRRSNLSASFNSYMERLLNSLAQISQRVNNYTGTDYSGISALRGSIIQQEELVGVRSTELEKAKEAHASALTAQTASHKEVVNLLERRNSWTDSDLEHYMSLVRSEHANEQAVQGAKDFMDQAEASLEEARVKLEKTERQQYHEEQIWSDTIRRNSTWVTIGLMGVNILLLLASFTALEPWRRKRLVREIRTALDERAGGTRFEPIKPTEIVATDNMNNGADSRDPVSDVLKDAEPNITVLTSDLVALDDEGNEVVVVANTNDHPRLLITRSPLFAESWSETLSLWRERWADLFSERRVVIAKVDLTTATLEGAAAGAAFMGLLFVLLRPR